MTSITPKPHYLFVTRVLIDLYHQGELPAVDTLTIEPQYGYVGRLRYHNGAVRLFRGTNIGVNNNGASEISKDKGYTKYFLDQLGYHTAPGKVFLMPRYHQLIDRNLSRYGFSHYPLVSDIDAYIQAIGGYPCYVKPNDESQGKGVYKCADASDLQEALTEYEREHVRTLLVEQNIPYPDYRVVIFDGELIACYQRQPLQITGDGNASIRTLLAEKQQQLEQQARPVLLRIDDPRIIKKLARSGYTLDSVPPAKMPIPIYDISNLSTGGEAHDFTAQIHPHWRELCSEITAQLGLRLCGVDLACADITDPNAAYSIIETNASPGLDNYATLGTAQMQTVRALYQRIFNEPPTG